MLRFILTTILLTGALATSFAQTLSGRVTDAAGRAIPYATVQVPGTRSGTLTDEAGHFELRTADLADSSRVVFSSIGYDAQSMPFEMARQLGEIKLESANYVLGTAEVAAARIKMKRKKIGMPGIMNGTFVFSTENKDLRHEIGTVLRPDQAAKLEEVIVKVRGMDADSVLLDVNIYRMHFGMVGEPLLKERVFLQLSQAEVGKDISIDLRKQGIEVEDEFLISLRILDVVGTFTGFRIAGKTGEAIGRTRVVGGRWTDDYMAPNIRARLKYPKNGQTAVGK